MRKMCLSLALVATMANANNTTQAKSITLGEVIVEATKSEQDSLKYAGGVGVLKSGELKAHPNVIEAMQNVPGVDGGNDFGREVGRRFQIRGFNDERVIIMQDGIRRSPGLYSGMISSFRTDSDILKRAEVVKGASSILYGSGAIGGIVSMQTKNAHDYLEDDERFGAMLGGRVESNNMHSLRIGVYGRIDDNAAASEPSKIPLDALVYAKKAWHGDIKLADGGPYEANPKIPYGYNDEKITTLFFKGGATFADSHRVDLSAFSYDEKLNTLWQTLNNNAENLFVKGKLKQQDYALNYHYNPLNDWMDFNIRAYKSTAKYDRGWDWIATQSVGNRQAQYVNKEDRYGITAQTNLYFETGFLSHLLVGGVEYENRKEDALWVREWKDTTATNFASQPNEYNNLALYIQDVITYNNLEVTLGGRFDRYDRQIKKSESQKFQASKFSPRVALAYTFVDGVTLLGGYAQSFRAPTPHETSQAGYVNQAYYYIANPNLKAETAKEYEIGLSYAKENLIADDALSFKGVYFYGNINDMIALKALPEMGTPPASADRGLSPRQYGQYQNVDNAVRHGYELSANYQIKDYRISTSFERLKVYDKKTKEDLSKHAQKLQLQLGWTPMANLDLAFHLNHYLKPHSNPSTLVSRGVTYYYVDKSFTLADFKASYKIPKGKAKLLSGADITLGVNNIFDKQYINAGSLTTTSQVGRGRNFYVDIEMKF